VKKPARGSPAALNLSASRITAVVFPAPGRASTSTFTGFKPTPWSIAVAERQSGATVARSAGRPAPDYDSTK
jgi:hypothetical protein